MKTLLITPFHKKWKHLGEEYYKNLYDLKVPGSQKSKDSMFPNFIKDKLNKKTSHCSKNLKWNISINELKTVVKRLKMRKAIGLDQISN